MVLFIRRRLLRVGVIKIVVTFLNYIFIINICESIKYVCQNILIGLGWQYQHKITDIV